MGAPARAAIIMLLAALSAASPGTAMENPPVGEDAIGGGTRLVAFSAEGITAGLVFPIHSFGQDFDGNSLFLGENGDLLMLPQVEDGAGVGLNVGMLFHLTPLYMDLGVDFTFARTDHAYTWREHTGTLRNHYFSVTALFAGPVHWGTQPYFRFGWGSFVCRLNHGLLTPGGEAEVAWHYGELFTPGLGVNLYLNSFWKIWVEFGRQSRRLTKYAWSLPGVKRAYAVDTGPKAGGRSLSLGITRTFSQPFPRKPKALPVPESSLQEQDAQAPAPAGSP